MGTGSGPQPKIRAEQDKTTRQYLQAETMEAQHGSFDPDGVLLGATRKTKVDDNEGIYFPAIEKEAGKDRAVRTGRKLQTSS